MPHYSSVTTETKIGRVVKPWCLWIIGVSVWTFWIAGRIYVLPKFSCLLVLPFIQPPRSLAACLQAWGWPPVSGLRVRWEVSYQLSAISCQLSPVNFHLSGFLTKDYPCVQKHRWPGQVLLPDLRAPHNMFNNVFSSSPLWNVQIWLTGPVIVQTSHLN